MNWKKHKRNKRGFTRDQCSKGGQATRGYETAEEVRQRALQDAKGMVIREGVTYRVKNSKIVCEPWTKRRALYGRTDQIEFTLCGKVVKTAGETTLWKQWRPFRGD
jgi:hypothetical protein